ncbi:MAG: hypothetical protein Q4C48_08985 [Lachnospiraceae bacterium]|nr:hypothetical protein [Lachnospiraceae bacterium]
MMGKSVSDGTLVFDTRIDEKGLLQGLRESAKETEKQAAKLRGSNKNNPFAAMEKQAIKLERQIADLDGKLDELYDKRAITAKGAIVPGMSDADNQGLIESNKEWQKQTALIENAERQLEDCRRAYNELIAKMQQEQAMMEQTGAVASASVAQRRQETAGYRGELESLEQEQRELGSVALAAGEEDTLSKEAAKRMAEAYRDSVRRLSLEQDDAARSVKRIGKAARDGFGTATKSAGSFQKRLRGIIGSALIFSQFYKVIHSLMDFMGSAAAQNDEFSQSLKSIKANLLTAFAPIYNTVMPFVNWLLKGLEKITQGLAKITAQLFGWTVEDAQKAADSIYSAVNATEDYTEAVKEAERTQAGFDELHNLQDSSSSASTSGSGNGNGAEDTGLVFKDASEFQVPAVLETVWKITCKLFNAAGKAVEWAYGKGNSIYRFLTGDETDYGTMQEQLEVVIETIFSGEWKDALKLWMKDIEEAWNEAFGYTLSELIEALLTDDDAEKNRSGFLKEVQDYIKHVFLGTEIDSDNSFMRTDENGNLNMAESVREWLADFLYGDGLSENNAITEKGEKLKKEEGWGWLNDLNGFTGHTGDVTKGEKLTEKLGARFAQSVASGYESEMNAQQSSLWEATVAALRSLGLADGDPATESGATGETLADKMKDAFTDKLEKGKQTISDIIKGVFGKQDEAETEAAATGEAAADAVGNGFFTKKELLNNKLELALNSTFAAAKARSAANAANCGEALTGSVAQGIPMKQSEIASKLKSALNSSFNIARTDTESEATATGKALTTPLGKGIYNNRSTIASKLKDALKTAADDAKTDSTSGSLWDSLKSIGTNVVEGIKNGLTSKKDGLLSTIGSIGSQMVDKFTKVLGIHSPSRAFYEKAEWITPGIDNAILDGEDETMRIIQNYARSLPEAWTTPVFATGTVLPTRQSFGSGTGAADNEEIKRLLSQVLGLLRKISTGKIVDVNLIGDARNMFRLFLEERDRQQDITGIDPILGELR